ncbi:MAG: asparaginase [Candidatus Sericytochromatia bacterium]|nr:MAG: asparaginase [Candidatus Sericytochromatia bacterium]
MIEPKLLSIVKRNNIDESYHYGWFLITDCNNKIIFGSNKQYPNVFLRSSIKSVQALPLLYSNGIKEFKITEEELAIICASHSGERIHTNVVKRILKKINLNESYLKCGIHPPFDKETNEKLIKRNKKPNVLHCNCSGKHAGMLASCIINNWNINNYYDYNHPLQIQIRKILLELSEEKEENIKHGIDGCGVPTYSMNMKNIGILFNKLATLKDNEFELIRNAFLNNPYLIGGKERGDTLLIEAGEKRFFSKSGGEAIIGVSIPNEKLSIVLKIADGSLRCIIPTIIAILNKIGINNNNLEELKEKMSLIYNNDNKVVGNIQVLI